jgi:hypothetical protein
MAIESVSIQAEWTPGDDLSLIMEAALEAFEGGFELIRDQPKPSSCSRSLRNNRIRSRIRLRSSRSGNGPSS